MISFSVALDPEKGIGYEGKLPWHIKEELQVFKKNTLNKKIIVGQTTFDNLPGNLPERHIIVVSVDHNYTAKYDNVEIIYDLLPFLMEHQNDAEEFIVCGGASIYKQAYPFSSKAYVSFIKEIYPKDTYFSVFNLKDWHIDKEIDHEEFIERELIRK